MNRQLHTGGARDAQCGRPTEHTPDSEGALDAQCGRPVEHTPDSEDAQDAQCGRPTEHTPDSEDAQDAQCGRPVEHTPDSVDARDPKCAQPSGHTRGTQDTQNPEHARPLQPARRNPAIPPLLYSLGPGDSRYPSALERWRDWCEEDGLFSDATPLACLGDLAPLQRPTLGLLCSAHCPGSVLLDTFRFVRTATPESPTFIGGFHSPMEHTCLDTLLVRHVPVIFCPGRRLSARSIPAAWKPAIAERRLLLLSPFSERQKRVDKALARLRNAFVTALADSLFVPYARPGGSVLALVNVALRKGKQVMTLDDPENAALVRMGARRLEVGELIQRFCLSPAAEST